MAKKDDLSNLTIEELMQLLEEKQNQMAQEKSSSADDDPDETVIYSDDGEEEIMLEESDSAPVNIDEDFDEEEEYDEEEYDDEEEVSTPVAETAPEPEVKDPPTLKEEKNKIEKGISSGKKYLQQALVSAQMGGYKDEVWETADADFRDLRRGTYPHVFESKSEVSFGGNDQFVANLKEYRDREAVLVEEYNANLGVIRENYKKHSADIAKNVTDKIKSGRRKGTLLSWLSMILGVALGGVLLFFSAVLSQSADAENLLTAYKYYIIACYIGLGLAVGSFVFNVLFLIIGHKRKLTCKKKLGVITVYDPITWKKIKHQCEYKPRYKGRLWTAFIVLILVLVTALAGGYMFVKGFTAGEYNVSDEGYLFSISKEYSSTDAPVAYIEGVKNFSSREESIAHKGYYDVTVPATLNMDGVEYEVIGLGENAFRNNEAIISLKIGSNVREIADGALQGCKNLQKLVFEDNLRQAKDAKIARFFGLDDSLNLSTDAQIREYVPKALKRVEYSNVRSSSSSTCTLPVGLFANLVDVQKITVKTSTSNRTVYVREGAYLNCKSLEKIELPLSATFESRALQGCTGLKELTLASLPEGSSSLSSLASIFNDRIPYSLERIYVEGDVGEYAFYNCTGIKVVDCRNASEIGSLAFGNCTSLIDVLYSDDCTVASDAFQGSSLAD